ncbi:S10 family peptidase [Sandaracinobacteroides saxicola]|uniref:Peptidase S10 n=1 Tax=Sandaracinobacteroides saxicola TaxID=2759707 RepID=A0A7G5IFJ1_9SPHN|nr:peptidase S10 [Sandaracinobacteroides saxicola]QMW22133.1 peptidase S10 [Sandaracinobacteroides saxicola]
MRHALLAAALSLALPLQAQDKPKDTPADVAVAAPIVSVTRHQGVFGGQTISFTATAGETVLKDREGKAVATIVSTAYVRDGGGPNRPVTFLWNGGPGSGSVWLHMGAFGPKRVVIPGDARDDGAPPFPLVDNPHSLLDVTDIVFIDPVGTGFSRVVGKGDPKDYWGVTQDAKSVATFIRAWLRENGRWNAPKFIGGESYGTTRSAAVINELEGSFNDVSVNGIILISTILDFGLQAEVPGNEMAFVVNLPNYTTAAWYHKALPAPGFATVVDAAAAARAFAAGPYLSALAKGNALPADERATVRKRLAELTGLSEAYLDKADLRVLPGRFYKELLRERGLTIGRLDGRYIGIDFDRAGEEPDNDPSFYGIDAGYTAAINAWMRGPLKFNPEREYSTIGGVSDWDWRLGARGGRNGDNAFYMNVTPYIGRALRENSGLRVFVAQGWYDHATPFFGAEYALSRTGIPAGRVEYHYYDAGHMMYVREADLAKLSTDVRGFIRRQVAATGR